MKRAQGRGHRGEGGDTAGSGGWRGFAREDRMSAGEVMEGAPCRDDRPHLSPPAHRCQWPSDTAPAEPHNQPPSAGTCWLSCVGRDRGRSRWRWQCRWGELPGGWGGRGEGGGSPLPDTCWTPPLCSSLQTARSGRWPEETRGSDATFVRQGPGPAWGTAGAPDPCLANAPCPLPGTRAPDASPSEREPRPKGPQPPQRSPCSQAGPPDSPSPSRCPPAPSRRSQRWRCGAWPRS